MSPEPTFDQHGTLPGQLVNPSKQLLKFIGYFLASDTQEFNWAAFKDAVDSRPDTDLFIEQYDNNRIVGQEAPLQIVVGKSAMILGKVAGPVVSQDALYKLLLDTFTSLKEREENGCASYEESNGGSSFSYRLVFLVPNPDISSDFYALLCKIKLTANITDKETWYSLNPNSEHNFGAEIECMRLVCNENFAAGPKPPM